MSFSDLLTITEVDAPARSKQIAERGWGYVVGNKSPRDESSVAWRKSKFNMIYGRTHRLTKRTYLNDRGWRTAPPYGTFVVLETEGKKILVGVTHFPWGVVREILAGKKKTQVALSFASQYAGFKRVANRLAKRYDADAVLLTADWNIDIKSVAVRTWFKATAPTYKVNWKAPYPRAGTLGRRLIDISLLRGRIRVKGSPRVLAHDESSDHTPFAQNIELY